ncbi:MAG: methyltransferase [Lachnospiraceae bacterium]|nr:methyltransferase [Lachnospiraceae bacterium]
MIRLDDLENGYFIYQDTDFFCFGIDAVLLAHFAKLKPGDRVLDLCTGNGIVPLLMHAAARDEGVPATFAGMEILQPMAELAARSVRHNHLENDIEITEGDLREAVDFYGPASFSLVTCNPPYMRARQGLLGKTGSKTATQQLPLADANAKTAARQMSLADANAETVARQIPLTDADTNTFAKQNPHGSADAKTAAKQKQLADADAKTAALQEPYTDASAKTIARHEILCTLCDVICQSAKVLKSRGRFAMVHRPGRLPEIFALLREHHLEPKRMQLVCPYVDKAPTMVLIEAVKGGGPQLNVEPPLIVYNADRTYTEQVLKIYGKNAL